MDFRIIEKGSPLPYDLLLDADPMKEYVDEYCARGTVVGGYEDDRIIGVYVLIKTRPMTLELVNVAIAPDKQGQGLGQKLVADALSRARESGVKILEVGTGNCGIAQLAFYQKAGFRIVGVDLDFFTVHYPEPIFENGIQCRDMIRMQIQF